MSAGEREDSGSFLDINAEFTEKKEPKQIIDSAFKKVSEELQEGSPIGITFKDGDKVIGIPTALMDLVATLNPKDDPEMQKKITDELFKDKK